MAKNFTLDAFRTWADRLHGGKDKQSWSRMFRPGVNLWRGLKSVYSFIHYGTGGGLTRPLYAEFFSEAHAALGIPLFQELSGRYHQLGVAWDELGEAALPDDIDLCCQYRNLCVERAELTLSGGEGAAERIHEIQSEFDDFERSVTDESPLTDDECDDLCADPQCRVRALHRDEMAVHQRLCDVVA